MQRIFNCDKIQDNTLTLDKILNSLIHGSPFCVIIYTSYKLSNMCGFYWATVYLSTSCQIAVTRKYIFITDWYKLLTCKNSSALIWVDDCCSPYSEDGCSDNRSLKSLAGCRTVAVGSRCSGGCDGVRMSTAKSLRCLETFVGTSRLGAVTEFSADILLVCRRPLTLSLLESRGKAFVFFLCCCCGEFLSDAATFCNLLLDVCVDEGLPLAGVSTRCVVAFIGGVEVLDVVPVAGKPVSHIPWSCQLLHCQACDTWPVHHQTYSHLPSLRATPPLDRYKVVLLGDRGIQVNHYF